MPKRNIYEGMSALDFRYYDPDVAEFLSEEAFIWAKCKVETALVRAFVRMGMCDQAVLDEIVGYIVYMVKRLTKALAKLQVHREHCEANLRLSGDLILAEPLYLLLASLGHPNAHEVVRLLTLKAREEGRGLFDLASENDSLRPYLERLGDDQTAILTGARPYHGFATIMTERVARSWAERFSIEIE